MQRVWEDGHFNIGALTSMCFQMPYYTVLSQILTREKILKVNAFSACSDDGF